MGNIVNDVVVLKELETIKFTNKNKIEGSEKHLELYKKHGQLKSVGSIDSHVKNLELFYESVEPSKKVKGTDRLYTLKGKRKRRLKKEPKKVVNTFDLDDLNIQNYIFNKLLEVTKHSQHGSIGYWSKLLNMPTDYSYRNLESLFEEQYGSQESHTPLFITQQFHADLVRRSKSYTETAFRQLNRNGKIKMSDSYYEIMITREKQERKDENNRTIIATKEKKTYNKISKKRYVLIKTWIVEQCEFYSLTIEEYTEISKYPKKKFEESKKEARIKINEKLKNKFSINGVFKGYQIKMINTDKTKEVKREVFMRSYFNKFIKNAIRQQDNEDYRNSHFPNKAFYLFNNLIILRSLGVKELDDLIEECRPSENNIYQLYLKRIQYVTDKESEERKLEIKAF